MHETETESIDGVACRIQQVTMNMSLMKNNGDQLPYCTDVVGMKLRRKIDIDRADAREISRHVRIFQCEMLQKSYS